MAFKVGDKVWYAPHRGRGAPGWCEVPVTAVGRKWATVDLGGNGGASEHRA